MTDTLKSVVEEELQKAYERGVQDGKKQERALWGLSRIGQEIEHVHAVNISEERVHKTEKNEHEPVAWWHDMGDVVDLNVSGHGTPLYFAPPKKEWRGLTGEELKEIYQCDGTVHFKFALIEAKLKEKNNG